jgi:oligosaccharide repeat unit polymerase
MWAVSILLAGLLLASRRTKGPIWVLSISWLICLLPIATGVIDYTYFSSWDVGFAVVLTTYLLCFVAGVVVHDRTVRLRPTNYVDMAASYRYAINWALFAWVAGIVGTLSLIIDFVFYKGAGLDDLAALRDLVVTATSATWFARISSVLSWGGLYCLAFAMYFKDELTRSRFIFFILPIMGYFLTALLSAGRQAALQILIFALLIQLLKKSQSTTRRAKHKRGWVLPLGISLAMLAYMGYIAIARNDGLVSNDKTEVLATLFDYTLSSDIELVFGALGNGVRATLIEGLVYFSSSVALFLMFLKVEFSQLYLGVMSFPFVMRQLEPLTGISVIGALETKIQLMYGAGVIGVGWTTGISSYIIDFGRVGAAVFLFLQGFYTAYAWRRAVLGNDFHDTLVALILLTLVIYMPLIAASSDTNLFLLWVFGVVALALRKRQPIQREIAGASQTPDLNNRHL